MSGKICTFGELFLPYKKIQFLEHYFEVVAEVDSGDPTKYRHIRRSSLRYHAICWLVVLYYVVIFVCNPDRFIRTVTYDALQVFQVARIDGVLIIVPMVIFTAYITEAAYFRFHSKLVLFLHSVLIKGKDDFFLHPRVFGGKPVVKFVRQFAMFLVFLQQAFVVAIYLFNGQGYLQCIDYILTHGYTYFKTNYPSYNPNLGVFLALIIVTCGFVRDIVFWLYMVHLFALVNVTCLTYVLILGIKLVHMRHKLQHIKEKRIKSWIVIRFRVKRFIVDYRKLLVLLHWGNIFYLQIFVAFLVINVPANVRFVVNILFITNTVNNKIGFSFAATEQWIYIFAMHLVMAQFTKHLAIPNKTLFEIAIQQRTKFKNAINLQLNLHLQSYYIKNKYGFKYHKYGLITMLNFIKSVLFYWELLMYGYMLAQ